MKATILVWAAWLVAGAAWLMPLHAAVAGPIAIGPDSLRTALRKATADSVRARLLCQLSSAHLWLDTDSALALGQQARKFARRTRQPYWEAKALGLLAAACYRKERIDQAVVFRKQEVAAWKAQRNIVKEYKAIRQLGGLEYLHSDYPQALEHSLQALHYFEREKKSPEYLYALHDLFSVYMRLEDRARALHFFNKWMKNLPKFSRNKNIPKNKNPWFGHYRNIADFYNWLGDKQLALKYIQKARVVYNGSYLTDDNAILMVSLANAHYNLGLYKQARDYATEALAISSRLDLPRRVVHARASLAESWSKLGEHRQATAAIRQAIGDAHGTGDAYLLVQTYQAAAGIAEHAQQFKQALVYTHRYLAIRDSLFGNQNQQRIKVAEVRYENYRREQEAVAQRHKLAELRSERRIARLSVALLTLALLAGTAAAALLVRQRRLRAERDTAALRAQQAELHARQLEAQEALRQTQHALELKAGELAGLALKVNHKEQLMEGVKEELGAVAQSSDGDARTRLRRLQQSLAVGAQTGPNWEYFQQVLEQAHPRFFVALQRHYPELTINERRLAALLRLNLTTKDLAAVMNISDDGVKKARYRLRRKFNLSSEDSLTAFIFGLDATDDTAA